jgi:hypothetical protein
MPFMRTTALAILALGLIVSLGAAADAADLSSSYRSHGKRSHAARGVADWPRLRVVEQVPNCGDCNNLIGQPSGPYVRLRYIGYLPWTRGCALGGCYGAFNDYGCYWQDAPVADGRGGWTRGIAQVCD